MPPGRVMLSVTGLHAGYGAVTILRDVSIEVGAGEIVALIGANGAGKTTLVNAICGLVRVSAGSVVKNGADITGMPAHRRIGLGTSAVLENRRLWPELTVKETLRLAEVQGRRLARGKPLFRMEEVIALFPILGDKLSFAVELLSGGQQQMVAIARALLLQPDLLIMDEPSTGLAPVVVREIHQVIEKLRNRGISLLLVEQNVGIASAISDRGYVMALGRVVHTIGLGGWPNFLNNPALVKAYLGG